MQPRYRFNAPTTPQSLRCHRATCGSVHLDEQAPFSRVAVHPFFIRLMRPCSAIFFTPCRISLPISPTPSPATPSSSSHSLKQPSPSMPVTSTPIAARSTAARLTDKVAAAADCTAGMRGICRESAAQAECRDLPTLAVVATLLLGTRSGAMPWATQKVTTTTRFPRRRVDMLCVQYTPTPFPLS